MYRGWKCGEHCSEGGGEREREMQKDDLCKTTSCLERTDPCIV